MFLGLIVLVVVFFVVKNTNNKDSEEKDSGSTLIDVAPEDRPVVSLIPTSDGHYLKLVIENIVIQAQELDYELLYQTGENITQGIPGSVELGQGSSFELDLLLGSESSGKFRYDEGVEE